MLAQVLLNECGKSVKKCKVCGVVTSSLDFPFDKYIKGGVSHRCVDCIEDRNVKKRETSRLHRKANRK